VQKQHDQGKEQEPKGENRCYAIQGSQHQAEISAAFKGEVCSLPWQKADDLLEAIDPNEFNQATRRVRSRLFFYLRLPSDSV
jgi:hypothetical protein